MRDQLARVVALLALALAPVLAVGASELTAPVAPSRHIAGVPSAEQRGNWCGPAALAAVLQFYGLRVTAAEIAEDIYLPGYHGSLNLDLLLWARKKGLQAWAGEGEADDIRQAVSRGRPVICMLRRRGAIADRNHFVVIRGYDQPRRTWLLDDGSGKEQVVSASEFERDWAQCRHWMMVVGEKAPPGAPGHAKR